MSNYFSNFISRFQVGDFGLSTGKTVAGNELGGPDLSFITVYNPSWALDLNETLEGARKQILFFLSSKEGGKQVFNESVGVNDPVDASNLVRVTDLAGVGSDGVGSDVSVSPLKPTGNPEHVHIVGLLRGSHALVEDFGATDGPIAVTLSNQVVVIVEIEPGFFLACCTGIVPGDSEKELLNISQTEALLKQHHLRFKLFNSSFDQLIDLYGKERFCTMLSSHWENYFIALNCASEVPFGPRCLNWPTRLNHEGALLLLKQDGYRKSSTRILDLYKAEMDDLARTVSSSLCGWSLLNVNRTSPSENGLVFASPEVGTSLDQTYITSLHEYLQLLNANYCLSTEFLLEKNRLAQYFRDQSLLYKERHSASLDRDDINGDSDQEDDESNAMTSSFPVNPSAALDLLNPITLTNNLLVLPLTSTVSQVRNLGLAFTDKIVAAPDWLPLWRGTNNTDNIVGEEENGDSKHSTEIIKGSFLTSLIGGEILYFLVYIPTTTKEGKLDWTEYIVVIYQWRDHIINFIYESGLLELSSPDFYKDLEKQAFVPILELLLESERAVNFDLAASLSSLNGPPGSAGELLLKSNRDNEAIIKKAESQLKRDDMENDFFYIIYDRERKSYQTSLPNLADAQPVPLVQAFQDVLDKNLESGQESQNELTKRVSCYGQRAVFHLHSQLAGQFLETGQREAFFTTSTSDEHLHKFSSSKNNDWLFYAMKYKMKVIVIIRNYNNKVKPKAPLEPANSYMSQVADSVYGAANLGFLDNLGGDVKGWLGRLGTQEE